MSPQERRVRRRFLRAAVGAVADLPVLLSRLVRRGDAADARRRKRKWTRPRRIAAALVVLLAAAVVAATAVLAKRSDPARIKLRLHAEAYDQFEAGRCEEAIATWRKILDIDKSDKNARFDVGLALLKLGRREEGLREIAEVARSDARFGPAHLALAQDAASRGDDDTASAELRLVVADDTAESSRNGAAHSMLASILLRRGRSADAMPHLEASVRDPLADPLTCVRDNVTLGRLHGIRSLVQRVAVTEKRLESDCYAAAKQAADDALAHAVGDDKAPVAELHAARAEVLLASMRSRDESQAREALADADEAFKATKDPALRAEIGLLRAQIYSTLGDAALADKELVEALSGDAKPSAAAFRGIAGMYSARGQFDRALEVLSDGVKIHAVDVDLGLARAETLFAAGTSAGGSSDELDAAESECARVADLDKKATAAPILAGDVRRARDDLDGARRRYEEALKRDPHDVRARLRVAGTAIDESGRKSADASERLAEAERIADEVLAETPNDPGALLALAKVMLSRSPGRDTATRADPGNAKARRMLLDAVDADPLSIEARTFLGYADYLSRRDEEGAVELKQVLAAFPDGRPWLRVLLARCLYDSGSYPAAAEEAARATEGLPDEIDAWSVRAAAAREAGDVDVALRSLRRLDELDPKNLAHLFGQAALLGKSGKFAAAEERFSAADERVRAIADEDERSAAEVRVAQARSEFYALRGDIERARGALGAVVAKNPTKAAAYVTYAKFLLGIGQTEDAERQVERALAAEPSSLEARRLHCEIEFQRRTASPILTSQIDEVARAATKSADAAKLLDYLRGKLATLQGDLRVAKELLSRYVAAAPDDPDGQYSLGATLSEAGEFADAVKRFEAAGALLPGSPAVRVALAKTRQAWALDMMRRGRFAEAQATLRRAATDDPSSREVHALLADSLRFTGDVDLSEKEVRALLRADPADRAALRMLAAIHVQQGRLDAAAATLKDLVKVAADDWSAWQFLSAVLADKGDIDAAETAANASRAAAPDEPGALAAALHVLVLRGDFAGAEREIAAARERRPEEPQFPYFLAMLREQQGRHEDAVAAAAQALALRPAMPSALQLAILALSNGLHDAERAAAFARESAAKAKDDPTTAFLVAQIEADLGHGAAALALLEPLCAAETPPPAALSLRGLLLLDAGDYAGARAALKKGVAAYADAPDLHYLLAQSWLADPANVKDGEPQEPARGFAVAELRAALAVAKTHAPALNNLAWLLSRDESTRAEALQCAEAAVRMHPEYPQFLDTWATVLSRIGRKDQALAALQRTLGACGAERARIDQLAGKKLSTIETSQLDALKKRLDSLTADVKARYDEALRASTSR